MISKIVTIRPVEGEILYVCDLNRHLVCIPYSIENLHKMAEVLDIKRGWYHAKKDREHYDIPKKRIEEIKSKCVVVDGHVILQVIKGEKKELTVLR